MNMKPTYFWNFWVNMFWQIFFWFLTVKSTKFWRNLFWREIWITELRHLAALTETSERDVFKKRKQNKNLSYEKKIFRIIWKSRNGDKIRGRSRWSWRQWPNPDQFTDQRTTNHWGKIETSFFKRVKIEYFSIQDFLYPKPIEHWWSMENLARLSIWISFWATFYFFIDTIYVTGWRTTHPDLDQRSSIFPIIMASIYFSVFFYWFQK